MKTNGIRGGAAALLFAVALTVQVSAAPDTKSETKGSGKSSPKATAKETAHGYDADKARVSVVYDHVLPNVPGKSMKGILVEYLPGGSSPCHTHPKSAFIYATVLEGAITSQVNDGPVKTYKAGENFSEFPGDKHGVSRNASNTKPAKLLAVFVLDTKEKEITTVCKD